MLSPNRDRSGEEIIPCRVVAPTSVKRGTLSRTERAPAPCSSMMSMKKSSIALYRYSSTVVLSRWISSMNRMSPGSSEVSSPARSPGFSIAGPLELLRLVPRSLAMM